MNNGEFMIEANGVKHWVKIAGVEHNTIPLVAIHGGPGGNQWILENTGGKLLEEFATIVYYEQRGCGRSESPTDPDDYSMEILLKDLDEIRHALKLDKIIPLGHSFGGEIALEYTAKYPQYVAKTIVEAPAIGDWERLAINQIYSFTAVTEGVTQQKIRKLLTEGAPFVGRNREAWALSDEETQIKFSIHKKESDDRIREISTDDAPGAGNENMRLKIQEVANSNLLERVRKIELPVLVLTGLYDGNTGIDMARDIYRNLQDGQIEIFMESGHYIQVEESDKMASAIREFIL